MTRISKLDGLSVLAIFYLHCITASSFFCLNHSPKSTLTELPQHSVSVHNFSFLELIMGIWDSGALCLWGGMWVRFRWMLNPTFFGGGATALLLSGWERYTLDGWIVNRRDVWCKGGTSSTKLIRNKYRLYELSQQVEGWSCPNFWSGGVPLLVEGWQTTIQNAVVDVVSGTENMLCFSEFTKPHEATCV